MKKLFLITLIIILIASLIISGCARPAPTETTPSTNPTEATTTEASPKYGGILKVLYGSIGTSFGWPADAIGNMAAGFPQASFETLLRGDNKGNIYPWLAESYKVADDLKSITFILRKGIKFHDGSEFNAEVAKWNLDNYISAQMEPYWASVDIIDGYTVRVNFIQWMNNLPASFGDTSTLVLMVSKAAFDNNGIEWMRANPVGTGPFKFVSFTPDVNLTFVKNPDYWVKGKPYLEGLEYIFVADEMTQRMAMETGEADSIHIDLGKQAADLAELGLTLKVTTQINKVLVPDTANVNSPWANKQIREAVEYAIDREAISKAFGYGYLQAAYQIPPRYTLAYNSNFILGRQYNPEKAKQLLEEAGYPDGFETTIIVMGERDINITLQADLAKVGIQAELDFPEASKMMTYMGPSGTWPKNTVIYMPLPAIDVNYIGGMQVMFSMIGQSWLRTPELTQAYQAALTSPAPDIGLVRAVTDLITKEALLIPIIEGGAGRAERSYVIAANNERGTPSAWNTEDVWLNK